MLNREEAKQILLLYRPGQLDPQEPDLREAIEMAARDPELGKWFEEHKVFQASVRARLRGIEPPPHLKAALLARQKTIHLAVPWRRPVWLAAAAAFVALLVVARFIGRPSVPDHFADYRETMVSAAIRVYGMDLQTDDGPQLRQFIASKGAPADYQLTPGLERLQLKGGGLLRWRGNPVSMVCFDRGGNRMLFLFVLKRSALKDPPPASPSGVDERSVDGFMTASWTHGQDCYLLAGSEEPGFAAKYVQP